MVRTVMCFGDSNTHGTLPMRQMSGSGRLGPDERWPGVVAEKLGPGWRVIEEGLPGRTTVHDDPIEGAHKNGLALLPALLETHRPLDLVVVMLGSNDLKVRFAVTAEDITASMRKLVRAIHASDAGIDGKPPAVLVVAPLPIRESGLFGTMMAGGEDKSHRLAALYAQMAEAEGAHFLDGGKVAAVDPEEGLHFGASEHAKLGTAIAGKIAGITF
ncbi:SGNH/GDSL hydrolase family protein [Radicibacter daui]|uniref:SGNH/GDSL hydrolase family protein n=1 Tax=Radicibacter daui TaxID=3064829 RepID=UPI004046F9C3